MATNFVAKGEIISVTAPEDVTAGVGVMVGLLFGVAQSTVLSGAAVEIAVTGVHTLAADTGLTIGAGDRVFWDETNNWVDETSASQQCIGVAVEVQDTVAETVKVLLQPTNVVT